MVEVSHAPRQSGNTHINQLEKVNCLTKSRTIEKCVNISLSKSGLGWFRFELLWKQFLKKRGLKTIAILGRVQINKRCEENKLWYALQKIAIVQNLWTLFKFMQILSMKTYSVRT